ncbi:MAG: hypothetical protein WCO48_01515 [Candidatus Taylorbacteria bacterium]
MPEQKQNKVNELLCGYNDPIKQLNTWQKTLAPMVPEKSKNEVGNAFEQTRKYIVDVLPKLAIPADYDKVVVAPKPSLIGSLAEFNTTSRKLAKIIFGREESFHQYCRCVRFVNDRLRDVIGGRGGIGMHNHLIGDAFVLTEEVRNAEREKPFYKSLELREKSKQGLERISGLQPGACMVIPIDIRKRSGVCQPIEIIDKVAADAFYLPMYIGGCWVWGKLMTEGALESLAVLEEDFSFQMDFLGDSYAGIIDKEPTSSERNATQFTWDSYQLKAGALRERRLWIDRAQQLYPAIGYIPPGGT